MTEEDPPRCRNGVCVRMAPGLCGLCADRLAGWVADLPGLWVRVHLRLARGQSTGERVSGTADAPIPARLDVLSFLGPSFPGERLDLGSDVKEATVLASLQVGDVPLLAQVEATVRLVCDELALSWPRPARLPARPDAWPYGPPTRAALDGYRLWAERSWPHRQAAAVLDFLARWGPWISRQPWADEYAQEVHGLWRTARTLAGVWDPRPEPVAGVACPRCDVMALVRDPGEDGRRCAREDGGCGRWLSDDEYERWVGLAAHYAKEAG